jgi:hypothetical protein
MNKIEKKKNCRNHGFSGLKGLEGRVYNSWENMKSRCLNKNNPSFYRYGGRGIKICDEWLKFENFFKDMGHSPSMKHTLNRINNDGHYSKDNCRWDTHLIQNRNNSNNIKITIDNQTKCLSEWCEIKKLNINTIYHRINRLGYEPYEAITMIKKPNKEIVLDIVLHHCEQEEITINKVFEIFKVKSQYSNLTKHGIRNNLEKLVKEGKITVRKSGEGNIFKAQLDGF